MTIALLGSITTVIDLGIYTLIVFAAFAGFYLLYSTSGKMKPFKNTAFKDWIRSNSSISKAIGIVLLLIPVVLLAFKDGLGAELFTGILLVMVASSMVIALNPLRYITQWYALAVFAGCILLETTIS